MTPTTNEDRRKELNVLVSEMRSHPSVHDETARDRAWVLSKMLGHVKR